MNSDSVIEENLKKTRIFRRSMGTQAGLGSEKKKGEALITGGGAMNAVNTVSQSLCQVVCHPSWSVCQSVGLTIHGLLFQGGIFSSLFLPID